MTHVVSKLLASLRVYSQIVFLSNVKGMPQLMLGSMVPLSCEPVPGCYAGDAGKNQGQC